MRAVSPGYFETLGIELLGGRTFDWADGEQENRPVILNRVLADQAWPGEDPIGRTILLTGEDTPFLVVGLVDDVRQQRLATEPVPEAYLPSRMIAWTRLWIAVRGEGEPETLLRSAQAAAWTIDGEVAFTGAGKLEDIVATTIADTRFLAGIMTVFGLLAMGIGAAGVYGMMSHSVAKTLPEIGIRMALGANGASILRRTLVGGLLPVAAGLLVGTMLALAGARLLEGSLYGVQPWDWPTFVLVPVVLLTTAVVACVLPASRAASVDPSLVLGSD